MDVLIVVGDQDNFHEVEDEIVSSPIWLSDILSDEGLVGQFVVHARRAEILAEHGRDDVIRAMRRHEIGRPRSSRPAFSRPARGTKAAWPGFAKTRWIGSLLITSTATTW